MKKEEYTIVKKAWKISVPDIVDPHAYDKCDFVSFGDTVEKAKYNFLNSDLCYSMEVYNYSMECSRDVEYTDLRGSRCKDEDIVNYNGREISRSKISQMEWMANRDAEALRIVNESPEAVCVVWAGCYGQYWGANHAGYTSLIERAGKYSAKDAYDIVMGSDYSRQESVIALDPQQFNSDIDVKIKNLEKDIENLKSCKV